MTTTTRTRDDGRWRTRELLIDDQVVCSLVVIDGILRIGASRVRMAGIGNVETNRKYRMKGYMRTLYEDTLRYMVDAGYDVSLLFGIPNFYNKFGYAVCLPVENVRVETRNAELAKAFLRPVTARSAAESDLPAIIDLYNQCNGTRNCSIVRSHEYPTTFHVDWWGRSASGYLFEDGSGHGAGYALYENNPETVNVIEVECADPTLYPNVLYEFARQAIDKRCEQINFNLPYNHPFAEFLQRYGCEWKIKHPRQAGAMMRIVNQAVLFDKIRPELTRRVDCAPALPPPMRLELCTDLGKITLPLGQTEGTVATIELSQDRLMQLIAGYRSASDLLSDPQVKVSDGFVGPWLDILFPKCHPFVWALDGF